MSPTPPDTIATVVVSRTSDDLGNLPEVIYKAMSPLAIIAVRALRVYLQTAVGLVTAGSLATNLMPAAAALSDWKVALGMALGPALVCAAQNTLELLARIDEKLPQMRP
jgi:hypothetical protein